MARSQVIDLTIDDDHDEVPAPFAFRSESSTSIAPALNSSNQPRPTQPLPTPSQARVGGSSGLSLSPSLLSGKPPALNGGGGDDGRGAGVGGDDRPIKRRKFDIPTGSGNGNGNGNGTNEEGRDEAKAGGVTSADVNREALMKCLRLQVIPHLDAALARLPQGVYDTAGLGTSIIGQVADKDFEYHFRRGNGRLAQEVESRVAIRIQNLVREHLKNPVGSLERFNFPCRSLVSTITINISPANRLPEISRSFYSDT